MKLITVSFSWNANYNELTGGYTYSKKFNVRKRKKIIDLKHKIFRFQNSFQLECSFLNVILLYFFVKDQITLVCLQNRKIKTIYSNRKTAFAQLYWNINRWLVLSRWLNVLSRVFNTNGNWAWAQKAINNFKF